MTLLRNPSHLGEAPVEPCLEPLGMSAIEIARRLHVPRTRIGTAAMSSTDHGRRFRSPPGAMAAVARK